MMPFQQAERLSDSFNQKISADPVSGWLFGHQESDNNAEKGRASTWLPPLREYWNRKDVDQYSVASVDDSVSISDSAHESNSSESSAPTSWTSANDATDIFLDEDEKEQQQLKPCPASQTSIELQEHLLKGIHAREQPSYSSRCPSNLSYHGINAQQSANPQPEISKRSMAIASTHALPQPCPSNVASDRLAQKCNVRRSACSSKSLSPPPKLKRDTDVTEQFVSLLIIFATRLITAIWPLSACPPMMSTCFNGAGVLPLRVFIQETLRRSKTSYSTLQVALYYLVLLKSKMRCSEVPKDCSKLPANGESYERSQCRAMQCGRRMFLSALMLASKYLQDRNYSARAWSKISGLRSNEINENEREYLQKIDYELHVPKESFDSWSKIVLALSKLSKERPQCRQGSTNPQSDHPGGGSSKTLADMVSQVDLAETTGQQTFSDTWWSDLIKRLDPSLVKDPLLADDFLRKNLPESKMDRISLFINKQQSKTWDTPSASAGSVPRVYDMNFSDTLKPRSTEQCKAQIPRTPQTPTQNSPERTLVPPMQPHLGNLPTPQATPRVAEKCAWPTNYGRPPLRCSASMDALRSMRRQCLMNANLERCPPPRPQGCNLPSMRFLMRPAETIPELSSASTTPSTFSPMSVTSESTSCTSRSRSSSISSNSSWSSWPWALPRSQAAAAEQFSSPLAQVCSSSDPYAKNSSTDTQTSDVPSDRSDDEGYASGKEPRFKSVKPSLSTSSEVDAVRVLLSLSAHSESSSQTVTPTPRRLVLPTDCTSQQTDNNTPRGHKRTLSKADHNLQAQVRNELSDGRLSYDVVEDTLQPFYDNAPKQWQLPSKTWAAPRRALPNGLNNKRVATYCSIQQFASAPDLASQYLKDSVITAS